jgi:hypothetical protein
VCGARHLRIQERLALGPAAFAGIVINLAEWLERLVGTPVCCCCCADRLSEQMFFVLIQ